MVQLHVKRGDESQFLFNTTVDISIETLIQQVTQVYNGRLKVDRICSGKSTLFHAIILIICDYNKELYVNVYTFLLLLTTLDQ